MEYITKINKRTGQNHYYTVVPNKSAQGGFFRKIIRTHRAFIRHARVHAVYFISNAAKMRLVLNFSIFRVIVYFRCLAHQEIIVDA